MSVPSFIIFFVIFVLSALLLFYTVSQGIIVVQLHEQLEVLTSLLLQQMQMPKYKVNKKKNKIVGNPTGIPFIPIVLMQMF